MGHVFEGGEIGGSMIGADAAFVVAEDHVHYPVQAVLHRPVAAYHGSELARQPDQGGDVKAGFALGFIDKSGALEKALRQTIETQPYTSVAIAVAIGWFFGRTHSPF